MWLPAPSSPPRTLTGTSARTCVRDETDSPRVIIHSRSAPETTASTTSLTVPPCIRRIALKSSRLIDAIPKRRASPIGALSGLDDGGRAMVTAAEARPSARRPKRSAVSRTSTAPERSASTAAPGLRSTSVTALASRSTSLGSLRGVQSTDAAGCGSGVTSRITWPMSMAPAPSTIAWWVLVRIANRPPERPSTRYISQSGRLRSSGRAMMRPTRSRSCASVPGRGSAERRTW